jgi:ribose/xylose/arabinose/galactoside ABC-type transport system permease subunit
MVAGGVLLLLGLLVTLGERLPVRPGQLPGDFTWRGKNWVVSVPLATSLVLSAAGTLFLWLLNRSSK